VLAAGAAPGGERDPVTERAGAGGEPVIERTGSAEPAIEPESSAATAASSKTGRDEGR
jgi:hypothetical protein